MNIYSFNHDHYMLVLFTIIFVGGYLATKIVWAITEKKRNNKQN